MRSKVRSPSNTRLGSISDSLLEPELLREPSCPSWFTALVLDHQGHKGSRRKDQSPLLASALLTYFEVKFCVQRTISRRKIVSHDFRRIPASRSRRGRLDR